MTSTMRLMGLSSTSLISLIPFLCEALLRDSGMTDCLPVTCRKSNLDTCSSILCSIPNCLDRQLASIRLFYCILNACRMSLASIPAGTKYFYSCLSFRTFLSSSIRFITIYYINEQPIKQGWLELDWKGYRHDLVKLRTAK